MTQSGDVANIGGTPALAGTCNVTCTVKDSHGNSVNATAATIVVSAATVSATAQVKPVAQPQK